MLPNMFLAILSLLVTANLATAASDPQFQKPTVADTVWESTASNQCGDSSFYCKCSDPSQGNFPMPSLWDPRNMDD
ncbi:hypothetical protein diail_8635 [Diaporthe ilicicola]|nr:hypothetical protein diail_8635 [Diaporthe ilicicola]